MSKCDLCERDLSADGIKDLIPLCHECYVQRNPEIEKYLRELKEMAQ